METSESTFVKILVMDRHFLYLPLYLAQFDHPDSGKIPWFGEVPSKYSIEITVPTRDTDRTDKAVFDALVDSRLASSDIMFAACDPNVLLARQDKNAMIAASLVASFAFWAVNHDPGDIRLVSELSSFDKILCYKPGTTSNMIARWIAKLDTDKLEVVNSRQEITEMENRGGRSLAISPEVLQIANSIYGPLDRNGKRTQIVLDLCNTKEFSNVLTTVLFTRSEVVEKYPDLVSGILTALQRALLAIHAEHPMVGECVRRAYRDAHRLDEALEIAKRGNVFPETIHVRHDRWQRACEFYYISQSMARGEDNYTPTTEEQRQAEQLYERSVLDRSLRHLVNNGIMRGFRATLEDDGGELVADHATGQMLTWVIVLSAAAFGIGQLFAASLGLETKLVVGLSWGLMLLTGWWLGEYACFQKPSRGYIAHWISFVLIWWVIHEIALLRGLPDAHFLAGVTLDGAFQTIILALAGSWLVGSMLFRFQTVNEVRKAKNVRS